MLFKQRMRCTNISKIKETLDDDLKYMDRRVEKCLDAEDTFYEAIWHNERDQFTHLLRRFSRLGLINDDEENVFSKKIKMLDQKIDDFYHEIYLNAMKYEVMLFADDQDEGNTEEY